MLLSYMHPNVLKAFRLQMMAKERELRSLRMLSRFQSPRSLFSFCTSFSNKLFAGLTWKFFAASQAPTFTIASNAGTDGALVVGKLLEQDDLNLGYDAAKGLCFTSLSRYI